MMTYKNFYTLGCWLYVYVYIKFVAQKFLSPIVIWERSMKVGDFRLFGWNMNYSKSFLLW